MEKEKKIKVTKGKYGYLRKRKRSLLIRSAILLIGIGGLVVLGLVTLGTTKNWLSIIACLSAIPMAMQMATFFSMVRYKERPYEEYKEIADLVGNGVLDCDIIVAHEKEKPLELYYVYIHEDGMFAFSTNEDLNANKAAEYIRNFLRLNEVDGKLMIYTHMPTFKKRLSELSPSDRDTCDERLLQQEGVFRAISM